MSQLHLRAEGQIATLTIDRVEKRNALSLEMWSRIPGFISEVEKNASVRVLVIRGVDSSAFASGVDIDEFSRIATSEELGWQLMDTVHAAESSIATCVKPVIAMIEGHCVGGGVELALACDLRFASRTATFAVPPAKLGLVYSLSSTRRLVELIGVGKTRDLLFSARSFAAPEAHAMGLVERVFEPEEIVDATLSYARTLCGRSQYSIRASKKIIAAASRGEVIPDAEIQRLRGGSFVEDDLKEGMAAFFEKRAPKFPWNQ
jgi:enoyl-CoA hydratase/carnithine racemase